jgi:hypothetical protein
MAFLRENIMALTPAKRSSSLTPQPYDPEATSWPSDEKYKCRPRHAPKEIHMTDLVLMLPQRGISKNLRESGALFTPVCDGIE